ncbi:metallophosphoesterase [Adhaeretor mobilis]|uniref:metallophosphoesterase n=1 Tax=Adhaeretor mobilis TaxID=1930276 RepID=UPI001C54ECB1|nr:metallophosphoesterase [Adhaeretor mobilis]
MSARSHLVCADGTASAKSDQPKIYRGPYLQCATTESIAIVWRTSTDIDPVVRYGVSPDNLEFELQGDQIIRRMSVDVAAVSDAPIARANLLYDEPLGLGADRSPNDRDPSTRPGTRQYEAFATGLAIGTRYYYGVYDGDELLAGADAEHHFQTLPKTDEATDLRLWVVGDSGTGGSDQKLVFQAMREFSASSRIPDYFLHVGDMAYGDGADEEFQSNFFDIYQSTLRNTVCWPAMGNHEGHTSRGISQFGPYYDAYIVPTASEAGGVSSGTEAYYSFDIGRTHFICLDSHDLDRSPNGAMAQWLMSDLEVVQADWLIAFWHHPPYTKGSHDSDREQQLVEMRTFIMPLLEAAGVDLVLAGHSHIYERSMLIDGAYDTPTVAEGVVVDDGDGNPSGDGPYRKSAGLQPHNGTVAIVAGHGGGGVSRKGTMPIMREIVVENGSLIIDLHEDTLTGTMIDRSGNKRDQFQIIKRGVVEHSPISNPWQPKHDLSQITEHVVTWDSSFEGRLPPKWQLLDDRAGRMSIERRAGTPYYQAVVTAAEGNLIAIYDGIDGPINECQVYLEFVRSEAPAGLVLGWQDANNYCSLHIDQTTERALFYVVRGGERKALSDRKIDVDFSEPLKIELEPVNQIVEVQINDEIEYTVNLDQPLKAGRLGIEAERGAKIRFAGFTIEKARP